MSKSPSPTPTGKPLKVFGPLLAVLAIAIIAIGARFALMPTGTGGAAAIGGPFALVDDRGETLTNETFAGRFMLIYFGYTYCPDVCPTSLGEMAAALDRLPEDQLARIAPIFISVDPERDTPALIGDYARAFHPLLIGLTGSPAQIATVTKAYKVYFKKVEQEAGAPYLVDHSSVTYLMGPDGRFITHFSHGTSPEEMAARLSKILADTPS
ncbi:SCO family protein [Rhodospirillum rubrum]|uniref:SCO family protein n=1 Tax=Rhodospirillum rubrum TaxID=1085 RepID=UPI00190752BE|nr:SCO family protein [Rhodospirillum rubrum]MBK1663108.1 SCO family protein [Rhodospirillum rubrum]MBK1675719.1 SCO family protein [Rhodospirillum rubrum]